MDRETVTGRAIVVDPVCGEPLRAEEAVTAVVRRELRFFCSKKCARDFMLAPWRYEDEEWADRHPHG